MQDGRWTMDGDRARQGCDLEREATQGADATARPPPWWTAATRARPRPAAGGQSGLDLQHLWSVRPGAYGPNPPDLDHEEFLVVARRPD